MADFIIKRLDAVIIFIIVCQGAILLNGLRELFPYIIWVFLQILMKLDYILMPTRV
jgi:hypothetical protein